MRMEELDVLRGSEMWKRIDVLALILTLELATVAGWLSGVQDAKYDIELAALRAPVVNGDLAWLEK